MGRFEDWGFSREAFIKLGFLICGCLVAARRLTGVSLVGPVCVFLELGLENLKKNNFF